MISNCVINLSTDKPQVLREIAPRPATGGRDGVSDVIAEDRLSPDERAERGAWVGCIAGALSGVTFTHEVADGMHGAIVRAVKPKSSPRELPLVAARAAAGCC